MAEFTMPSLGADMDEGLLLEWLVAPGDQVAKGDVVAVVETDKAAIEVECFHSGTVGRLLVRPGTRVPVGTVLAEIETHGAGSGSATGAPTAGDTGAPHPTGARRRDRPRAAASEPSGSRTALTGTPAAAGGPGEAPPRPPETARVARTAEVPDTARAAAATEGASPAGAVGTGAGTRRAGTAGRAAAPGPPAAAHPAEGGEPVGDAAQAGEPARPAPSAGPPEGEEVTDAARTGGQPAGHAAAGSPGGGSGTGAGPLVRHLAEERGVDLGAVHGTGRGGRITRADVERAAPVAPPTVRATPYARRLAHTLGVDLTTLRGTGHGSAVRAADVHAAARTAPEPATAPRHGGAEPAAVPRRQDDDRRDEHTATMRRAIGELMSRSKREIPHYYLSTTVDLAAAEEWLHRRNRGRPPSDRVVSAALLLKAAARAARAVPQLNGFWQDGHFVPGPGVHLGFAVSLRDGGLLTPVIHEADTLAPEAVMAALKDLVRRARQGRLRGSEVAGATLTVTSLGEQGVESVFGVIHPPQVALVGFGAVVERPWAVGGMLGVHPVVTVTLSADHRASDGAVGARYLTAVDRLLQEPEEL
ncbi:dihydrolipoamide acetyltransferase family protein [Streptomyces sp. bgisy154]|uniref:dihydrolipoamide acetyltransferase family protein n=1 Tax=Streptomyces sp. bgisy154 TaxID=3413794 RepID=UPI003D7581B3